MRTEIANLENLISETKTRCLATVSGEFLDSIEVFSLSQAAIQQFSALKLEIEGKLYKSELKPNSVEPLAMNTEAQELLKKIASLGVKSSTTGNIEQSQNFAERQAQLRETSNLFKKLSTRMSEIYDSQKFPGRFFSETNPGSGERFQNHELSKIGIELYQAKSALYLQRSEENAKLSITLSNFGPPITSIGATSQQQVLRRYSQSQEPPKLSEIDGILKSAKDSLAKSMEVATNTPRSAPLAFGNSLQSIAKGASLDSSSPSHPNIRWAGSSDVGSARSITNEPKPTSETLLSTPELSSPKMTSSVSDNLLGNPKPATTKQVSDPSINTMKSSSPELEHFVVPVKMNRTKTASASKLAYNQKVKEALSQGRTAIGISTDSKPNSGLPTLNVTLKPTTSLQILKENLVLGTSRQPSNSEIIERNSPVSKELLSSAVEDTNSAPKVPNSRHPEKAVKKSFPASIQSPLSDVALESEIFRHYQAVVKCDFEARELNQLSTSTGSTLTVESERGDWLYCRDKAGKSGLVPRRCLADLDGNPTALVLYDFSARNDNEITVAEGSFVNILSKELQEWWLVQLDRDTGLVPASYLQEATTYGSVDSNPFEDGESNQDLYDSSDPFSSTDFLATVQQPSDQIGFTEFEKNDELDEGRKLEASILELFQTESVYVDQLEQIVRYYLKPLSEMGVNITDIFSNLLEIQACAQKVLKSLDKAIRYEEAVAGAFLVHLDDLECYLQYCVDLDNSASYLQKLRESNPMVGKFLKVFDF